VFAINTSGELWAWGNIDMADYYITCDPIQLGSATDWASVNGNVVGGSTIWATKTTGKIYTWGQNYHGQLGHDNTTRIFVGPGFADPGAAGQQVGSLTDWGTSQVQYAVAFGGENQRGALKADGTIWGCGENGSGELGDGTTTNRSSPVQMGDSSDWTKVHGSYRGRLAINSSGELWGWGQNSGGRLGDGTSTNRSSPVQIGSDTTWTTARCGGSGALALKSG
jgi:alpha-tubulin suppressor-like RCC1 family protein